MFNVASRQGKAQYQGEMLRIMARLEQPFARGLAPLLKKQFDAAADMVGQGLTAVDRAVDKMLFPLNSFFVDRYTRVAAVFGGEALRRFAESEGKKADSMRTRYWQSIGRWARTEAATKVVKINRTTRGNIATVLSNGMRDGKSNADIAKELRSVGGITSRVRAARIARTETHTASVNAVNEATRSTGMEFEREWVASIDDRTRGAGKKDQFSHIKANGEKVGMEQPFLATGEALMFPGDPKGSPGNIINCRCVLLYHKKAKAAAGVIEEPVPTPTLPAREPEQPVQIVEPEAPPVYALNPYQQEALNAVGVWGKLDSGALAKKYDWISKEQIEKLSSNMTREFGTEAWPVSMCVPLEDEVVANGLLRDGTLKNQFQLANEKVSQSRGALSPYKGGSRDDWEKNIFDGALQKDPNYLSAKGGDVLGKAADTRPKYGFISGGDYASKGYGRSVIRFKKEVADRTTFTIGNSSGSDGAHKKITMGMVGKKGSWNNLAGKMLDKVDGYSLSERKTFLDLLEAGKLDTATLRNVTTDRGNYTGYIEAQIHGDISLARDVYEVVVEVPDPGQEYYAWATWKEQRDAAKKLGAKYGFRVREVTTSKYKEELL